MHLYPYYKFLCAYLQRKNKQIQNVNYLKIFIFCSVSKSYLYYSISLQFVCTIPLFTGSSKKIVIMMFSPFQFKCSFFFLLLTCNFVFKRNSNPCSLRRILKRFFVVCTKTKNHYAIIRSPYPLCSLYIWYYML